jgi:hypothetical protein
MFRKCVGWIAKRLAPVMCATGLIGWVFGMGMWDVYYDDGLHRQPDKAIGRVHVDSMHGVALYTTNREQFLLKEIPGLSMGLFLLGAVIDLAQRQAKPARR